MRNIFLFIRRYFNVLLFVVLQIICLLFIVHYSKYHQAAFGKTANQVTGRVNTVFNKIEYYFHLRQTNDSLVKANENLYNKLRQNFNLPDSVNRLALDSIKIDSLYPFRQYRFTAAKIIANSVTLPNNFLVLSKGSDAGFKPGMGVITAGGAVIGIITDVSENYSVVMSLLHKDSKISGKLLKTGETGTLSWDGQEPNILTMSGVSKGAKPHPGDSIITSGFSTTFPKGLFLGKIVSSKPDGGTSYLKITLRSLADFNNIEYGYVIDNFDAPTVNRLLEKALKQP